MPAPHTPSSPPSADAEPARWQPSRRTVLAALGTALTGSLAGCDALGDDTAAFHDGDWRSFGNGPANANRVAGGAPEPETNELLEPANWAYMPPVVHDGVAYFATDRRVVAYAVDGTEQWSRDLGGEAFGVPAVDPQQARLYVPTTADPGADDGDQRRAVVTVLSLADGAVLDTFRVGGEQPYGVTVADGDCYARSATACVRLGADGTERWRRPLDPLVYDEYNLGDSTATQVPPAVTADGVYVPDRDALVKLDRETGTERWRVAVDTPYAASVVDDGGVVQTGWQEIVAVTPDGEVRWRRDLHSRAAAAVDAGDVYVVAGDLHELDGATGETNWQVHLPSEGTAAPVVTDDSVVVASSDLRAFRRETGGLFGPDRTRWEAPSGHVSAYASPVVAAGRVFVASARGLQTYGVEDGES
ncbi:PQQ-binding-like beta-propeller repeat protein [Haloarcula onubensis]|uniref:PQQ-binding-like beta-propeller repeat protein n=1 Tax=Haloarcula onubensis TaxID=2950539 RepID=A0ABU2FPT6_9EURY|nr:PQQ-binding-like beta-propeller repeat protein [Halomicroarcula sp. S3CR25-11]MDS0282759.1 PQQ-binding-like beta-propeller repeat protein [Halomicroarcula sp. S3CR25-11]